MLPEIVRISRVNRRIVEARFDGGDITSDGGVLLLRQADRLTGLSDSRGRCRIPAVRRVAIMIAGSGSATPVCDCAGL